jgi:hypothetical protein
MRPPRFRIRTLMIAVAVVAISLCVEVVRRRQEKYRCLALRHEILEELLKHGHHYGEGYPSSDYLEVRRRLAKYHAQMKTKYVQAARYPWLSVPPDPPPPE